MTGPEHYREAERLLAESQSIARPHDERPCEADRTIAEAQVHATLALASATALQPSQYGMNRAEPKAWIAACRTKAGERDDD
ncbi:hypothetical protein ACFYM2_21400 [Streptomyces sp. NPDC006711]|uniref:hypothetical protein n=1 Tax=Streptomyces sp. NPDC006711 TaxID=3364762 RepID=UPI00368B48B5